MFTVCSSTRVRIDTYKCLNCSEILLLSILKCVEIVFTLQERDLHVNKGEKMS